ncbi:MAG: response regulator [Cellulophaga sp.]|nr:response regulator [Cellulophaga sp.]
MFDSSNKVFKILLVDDDGITNFITKSKLKNLGFENVNAVANGRLALDYLKNEVPDLIFLDINMPVMDGFDFLTHKEKNKVCPDVPVIVLSSSDRIQDQQFAKNFNNVVDYIEKPLNYEKIHRLLLKIVEVA